MELSIAKKEKQAKDKKILELFDPDKYTNGWKSQIIIDIAKKVGKSPAYVRRVIHSKYQEL